MPNVGKWPSRSIMIRFVNHPIDYSPDRFVNHPIDYSSDRFVNHPIDYSSDRFVNHPFIIIANSIISINEYDYDCFWYYANKRFASS